MKLIQCMILGVSAATAIGCAQSKFSAKAQSTAARSTASTGSSDTANNQPAQPQPPTTTQTGSSGGYSDSDSTGSPPIPSPSPSPTPNQTPNPTAFVCNAKFDTGYMCARGTGIALANNASAESLCRSYCDEKKAACCSLGRSNIAEGQGKVFCHASIYARVKYINNFAQLHPEAVDKGRETSIAALNCSAAQAITFSWGNEPNFCFYSQNYSFKQYGQVLSNADVLNATGGDVAQLEAHWYAFGNREGRDLYLASAGLRSSFNAVSYLANQPDVLLSGVNPWSHYQSCGIFERRPPK